MIAENRAASPLRRVLVVDDDRELARAIARALRRQHLEVIVASSAAMARVLQCEFALAVCDVELGDGCGVELARELTADGRFESVVFFTGRRNGGDLRNAETMGPVVHKEEGVEALVPIVNEKLGTERLMSGVIAL